MSLSSELASRDATAQAELVRKKEVKPIELIDAAIDRIERINPQINAVVTPMYDQARAAASNPLPDGPFTGVPFLLKDLLAAYAGVPMTSGSAFLRDFVPPHDSELVARYKRAGLIVVGKTNTPEYGILPTTEPALFGRDPESVGPDARDRGLERRFGCGGGRRHGAVRTCQRRRRLDSNTCFVLRCIWAQAHAGSQPARTGLRRYVQWSCSGARCHTISARQRRFA